MLVCHRSEGGLIFGGAQRTTSEAQGPAVRSLGPRLSDLVCVPQAVRLGIGWDPSGVRGPAAELIQIGRFD